MFALLDTMRHSLGDSRITLAFGSDVKVTNQFNDNSVTISGGSISGSQFAAGSSQFQGTINNISDEEKEKLDDLTKRLIATIQSASIPVAKEEVVDAIQQVQAQVKQKTINRLSINGLITGLNMVLQTAHDIPSQISSIYTDWSTFIHNFIS